MKKVLYLLGVLALSTCATPAYAQNVNADVNLNNAECIRSINSIGSTTYVNICNGTSQVVEWGGATWLEFLSVGAFFLCLSGLIVTIITMIYKDLM